MAQQLTREEVRDLIKNGNGRTLLLHVNTARTRSEVSNNYIKPTLEDLGWQKAGGEGGYHGMRGAYARFFQWDDKQEEILFSGEVNDLRNAAVEALNANLQAFAKPNEVAEVHVVITTTVLYDNTALDLLALPLN